MKRCKAAISRRGVPSGGALVAALVVVQVAWLLCQTVDAGMVKSTKELCFECHRDSAAYMKKAVVHKPLKLGLCTSCHSPHASRHSGLLSDSGGELCYNCHDRERGFSEEFVHDPVERGECLACHDAHAAGARGLLKQAGGKVCFPCHPKKELMGRKNVHPEVRKGNCSACHEPHSSKREGLLAAERGEICGRCHPAKGERITRVHGGYNVSGTDCSGCHSPHSSDSPAMLKATLHKPFEDGACTECHLRGSNKVTGSGTALCTKCHDETMAGFNRINSHLMTRGVYNPCSECHNPHASDQRHLLKGREDRVCYSCHKDTKSFVAGSDHSHPKLALCSDCHTAHGSNNRFFLSGGPIETCAAVGCHPTQGAFTHPVGVETIDPRSKTPMDCVTCHNPMGSPEEFILRFEKDRELCVQCHEV
ncbi:MAG: cytochrome c3 family protein [Thermodesulfobacteriota bacterium]